MNRFLVGAFGVVALTTSVSAADLAARPYTKAPPIAAAMYNWSGFYVGINGGGGSARKCWEITDNAGTLVNPPVNEGCHDATGGTIGGQIGYRWQSSAWVFGVEAQGNWANFKGNNQNLFTAGLGFPQFQNQSTVDSFGMLTGQIGYAVNNVLLYAKGGAAVVHDKYNNFLTAPLQAIPANVNFAEGSETRWGGIAGVGLEYGFAPNWSVAVEYDHLFMGTANVGLRLIPPANPATPASFHNIRQDVDVGTIRLNYRFGGPIVARY